MEVVQGIILMEAMIGIRLVWLIKNLPEKHNLEYILQKVILHLAKINLISLKHVS
jgi:hypothetical protein